MFLHLQAIHIYQFYMMIMLIFFVASLLISCCNLSSLIVSSIVMISFYILSKRFFLNCKGLSEARVVLVTKKEYGFAVHFFVKIPEVFKFNIKLMNKCNMLKLLLVWDFYNKKSLQFSLTSLGTWK